MSSAVDAPTAVILAGGLGTRIRRVLGDRPKPLAPVAGKPFLEWLILFLAKQGIARVIVSAGYRAEMVASFCASLAVPGVSVACVAERVPLGTAGGFLEAIASDPSGLWLVCNGDSVVCAELRKFIEGFRESDDAAMLALQVEEGSRYGNLSCDPAAYLTGFVEKSAQTGLINAGVYLLRRRTLPHFPAQRPLSFENDVFPTLLQADAKIRVYTVRAPFIDIGTESSLGEAESFIQHNRDAFI